MLPIVACLYGMNRECVIENDFRQSAEGLIVHAHPSLFLDYFAFVRQRGPIDPQRGHSVGFEPQDHRQILRRNGFPEHGDIVGRVGIALPTDRRDHRRVAFGLHVLGTLEHQMLEQMRKAGSARFFIFRTDVIPNLEWTIGVEWSSWVTSVKPFGNVVS